MILSRFLSQGPIFAHMKKEKTHGGARKGAGRKPTADPKVGVTLYIEESILNKLGGVEAIREYCYQFLRAKFSEYDNGIK